MTILTFSPSISRLSWSVGAAPPGLPRSGASTLASRTRFLRLAVRKVSPSPCSDAEGFQGGVHRVGRERKVKAADHVLGHARSLLMGQSHTADTIATADCLCWPAFSLVRGAPSSLMSFVYGVEQFLESDAREASFGTNVPHYG